MPKPLASRILGLVFVLSLAAHLLPLLRHSYLPSTDGPVHLFNSKLLLDRFGEFTPLEDHYYRLNHVVPPNVLGHLTLALLLKAIGTHHAENVLVGLYIVLLALGFRYFLRSAANDSSGYECLIFPFLYNMHVYWGFYNFCLSIAMFLFAVGSWLRWSKNPSAQSWLRLSLCVLLAFFSSPVGFVESCLSICFLLAAGRAAPKEFLQRTLWTAAALLPASLLYLVYLAGRAGTGPNKTEWPSIRYPLSNLFTLAPISNYGGVERIFAIAVVLLLAVLSFASIRTALRGREKLEWRFPALAALLALAVLAAPASASGGTMINPRLVYFPVFALCLLVPLHLPGFRWRVGAAALSLGAAFGLLILRVPKDAAYDLQVKALMAAIPPTAPGASLLFLSAENDETAGAKALTASSGMKEGAGGYVALERNLVLVNNYEATTDYFPFLYKKNQNPYEAFSEPGIPACEEIRAYERKSARPLDYIVLWLGSRTDQDSRTGYAACGYVLIGSAKAPYRSLIYAARRD